MMKNFAVAVFLLASTAARSAEIDLISGQYIYEAYRTTLRNGTALSLQRLGAQSATLAILPNMTLRMDMKMLDGTTTVTKAKILELKVSGQTGYFIAQWPDMNYPVREDFTFTSTRLSYIIRFTNSSDAMRYGSQEEATLKRAGER
jgi:hypothetical protein